MTRAIHYSFADQYSASSPCSSHPGRHSICLSSPLHSHEKNKNYGSNMFPSRAYITSIFQFLQYFTLHLHIHTLHIFRFWHVLHLYTTAFYMSFFTFSFHIFLALCYIFPLHFHFISMRLHFSYTLGQQQDLKLNFYIYLTVDGSVSCGCPVLLPCHFQAAPCLPSSACNIFIISL